jgi:hypothetical protein
LVRPLDGCAQRLVPFHATTALAREEPEPLVEMCRDVGRAHRRRARGREFDRERDAVDPAADLTYRRPLLLVPSGIGAEVRGSVGEQLHGRALDELCRPRRRLGRGQ